MGKEIPTVRFLTETEFRRNHVIPFLKANNFYYIINDACVTGTPDISVCMYGKFVAIELKTDHTVNKFSRVGYDKQMQTLKRIEACSGCPVLLYPSIFETFKDLVLKTNFFEIKKLFKEHYKKFIEHLSRS